MSLPRVFASPIQAIPSRLQRADASFELAPNTAAMITWMCTAILNNTVYLVQASSLLERVSEARLIEAATPTHRPECATAGTFATCAPGQLVTNIG